MTDPDGSCGNSTMQACARVDPVAAWLILSSWAVTAGWSLSAVGSLHASGFLIAFAGLCGLLLAAPKLATTGDHPRGGRFRLGAWRRRLSRPLPALFVALAAMAWLGGALHPPSNYDSLTYRMPRMLHWLAEGRWHWIATHTARMNYSGTGSEWLQTPLFLLGGGDRLLFLVNWLSFLLLPGLIFRVFAGLGVARQVAETWMWVLPCSYGFALQAGAVSNDAFATVYALAGVAYGLEARSSRRLRPVVLSLLAGALLTGVKASNAPLSLLVVVAVGPTVPVLLRRPAVATATLALCLLVSFVPISLANQIYAGHWTGDAQNLSKMRITNPLAGLVGNGLQLAAQTMAPPVMPGARGIENALTGALPRQLRDLLATGFPRFSLHMRELPQEESTGLGLLAGLLLGLSGLAAVLGWRWHLQTLQGPTSRQRTGVLIALCGSAATLLFMTKLGSEASARLLLPYAPFWVLAAVLGPNAAWLHRQRPYRALAILAGLTSVVVVAAGPARPLWPAQATLARFSQGFSQAATFPGTAAALASRARQVFAVYRSRNDVLKPLREHLPDEVEQIALVAGPDDPGYSLWRPFGTRQVVYPAQRGTLDVARPPITRWVVAKAETFGDLTDSPLNAWLARHGGRLVATESITSKASEGPKTWWLLHFPPPAH